MTIHAPDRVGLRAPGTARLVLSVCLLGWAVIAPDPATAGDVATLTLESVLEEAKGHNPELLAVRGRSQAMAAVPPQVSAWDDPTLTWEAWNTPEAFRIDRADNNIFRLSQRIPFPGKRRLAGEVATLEADQARHDVATVELELLAAVKRAYYDLWQAHERLAVLSRDKELVARFTHIVERKYGTGEATQSDVLRAQVELTHLISRLQTEQLSIGQAEAELNALLSRAAADPLGRPETPDPPRLSDDSAALVELALTTRPEVAAQTAAIARDETAVQLARRSRYPDFEVSVGRFINSGESDGFGAMASVTLPIFNGAKYGAAVDEATARVGVARSERRRLDDRIRREVEQAYLRARTALLQYDLFVKTHIPQAEQALRVTEASYESGEVPFLDLIDTIRSIESVHLDHIAAQADFEKARAELERSVGSELPRLPPGSARSRGGANE